MKVRRSFDDPGKADEKLGSAEEQVGYCYSLSYDSSGSGPHEEQVGRRQTPPMT